MRTVFAAFLTLLVLQRAAELLLAQRNRRWVLARGGREWRERRYPLIVLLHASFYFALALEWHYWSKGWNAGWPVWLSLLLLAQGLRLWAIFSLGRLWNTRIVTVPGMELISKGPYRYIRHPNYLAVVTEMFTIPVLCGDYFTATVFSLANAFVLLRRIPEEEKALEQATGASIRHVPRFFPRLRMPSRRRLGGPEIQR